MGDEEVSSDLNERGSGSFVGKEEKVGLEDTFLVFFFFSFPLRHLKVNVNMEKKKKKKKETPFCRLLLQSPTIPLASN